MDTDLLNFVSERLDQALRSAEILSKHQYKGCEWQVQILHIFSQGCHSSVSVKITNTEIDYGGEYAFQLSPLEGFAISEMLDNPSYGASLTIAEVEGILSRYQFNGLSYWVYSEVEKAFVGNQHAWLARQLKRSESNPEAFYCVGASKTLEEGRAIAATLLSENMDVNHG